MGRGDRIKELEKSLSEATFDIQCLHEEIKTYKQNISNYEKTIAAFPQLKMEYEDKLKKLSESHTNEILEMKKMISDTETSVNRRVTETLASIGVSTFVPEEILSVNEAGPTDLYKKFLSLKGTEQTEFYRKHEKELSRFITARTK